MPATSIAQMRPESSKLARARAATSATKKLAHTVPFGGVQTLPRRSPDASRPNPLIQTSSRHSTSPGDPGARRGSACLSLPSPNRGPHKSTAGAGSRYSEASHRSKQLFQPPKQLPGAGRATVSVGGAQLKVGDPIWMREEDRGSAEARRPAQQVCLRLASMRAACAPSA